MMPEERLALQRQVCAAVKAVWKLNPKLRLGQLLVTAMNELDGHKPRDLFDVEDQQLLEATEKMAIKLKAIKHRKEKK